MAKPEYDYDEITEYVRTHYEEAFEKGYFKVYYQPVVRALTEEVCGYEALIRWIDPKYGTIPPFFFIEMLEQQKQIHRLDEFVIETVCSDLRDDFESGFAYQPISVNLSRLDFELCDIKAIADKCRAKYRIPVEYLVIEITESAIASEKARIGEKIQEFRRDGYQVWMDDFGSGYSSLNNLQMYDFDEIKIDMNFLKDFDTNDKSKVIIASIVHMAKLLGIHTLTEGVETKEQFEFLKKIGCEKIQGYYFGKPKPVEEFIRQIDCSFDTNENPKYKDFYDKIGMINFLSSVPLRPTTRNVYNNLPISIIVFNEKTESFSFLFANEANVKILETAGISSLQEAERIYTEREDLKQLMLDVIKKAEDSGTERISFEYKLNGREFSSRIRFIARQGKKTAFGIVTREKI
ncbi:MAG TPA: hypothetical protein DEO83_09800 [Lachnospiraceae bacterium]|nr:hypothetical protein [Lachnospiraceae bacterium]